MLRMLSAFALKDRLLKSWPELQMRIMQLEREGSPAPGLRLPQAELSRKSNQVARARIRRFESSMPSHAVGLSASPLVSAGVRGDSSPVGEGRKCRQLERRQSESFGAARAGTDRRRRHT